MGHTTMGQPRWLDDLHDCPQEERLLSILELNVCSNVCDGSMFNEVDAIWRGTCRSLE